MQHNIQHTFKRFWLVLLIPLILLLTSCDLSLDQFLNGPPAQNQPSDQSSGQDQDQQVQDSPVPPTATDTPIPDTPTYTPSATASLTPTYTLTPTPYAYISQNTNCRYGPGSVYDLLHTYLAGQDALLLGKNAAEDFYYTEDGNGAAPDCWLWAKYATPVGDISLLPVFTPPPTPTPYLDFSFSYHGSDCGAGSCWLWFTVDNTGIMPLESVKVYAKNTVTSATANYTSNLFQTGIMGSDIASIPLSSSGYTHSGQLPNPGSDKIAVTITVCSKNDLNGVCLTRNMTMKP
ncbi:MAG: hypothetical protein ACK2TT_04235 [Anaerolineales bacterium]